MTTQEAEKLLEPLEARCNESGDAMLRSET
jgi:hypothetical protein